MRKYKCNLLKTKKSFQGTLNLSLNQYRCPKCFATLEAKVHSGTSTFYRYKSLDYYWIEQDQDSKRKLSSGSIKIVLNIKINGGGVNKRHSRGRIKIYDNDNNILRKKGYINSTVKPFLICKKCEYTKQLSLFTSKPDAQLFKNIL